MNIDEIINARRLEKIGKELTNETDKLGNVLKEGVDKATEMGEEAGEIVKNGWDVPESILDENLMNELAIDWGEMS